MIFVRGESSLSFSAVRLVSVGILGKEKEPGVGKLGWQGNFDARFERNTIKLIKLASWSVCMNA